MSAKYTHEEATPQSNGKMQSQRVACYNEDMEAVHPKAIRRRILTLLYERYMSNPLDMIGPSDFLAEENLTRQDLVVNVHYLHDAGLAELMVGYNPKSFNAVRITAKGIDLYEDSYALNRQFPSLPGEADYPLGEAARLVEELLEQMELSALDTETRRGLRQDIEYLRGELSRPSGARRLSVLKTVLGWIEETLCRHGETLHAINPLRAVLDQLGPGNAV